MGDEPCLAVMQAGARDARLLQSAPFQPASQVQVRFAWQMPWLLQSFGHWGREQSTPCRTMWC